MTWPVSFPKKICSVSVRIVPFLKKLHNRIKRSRRGRSICSVCKQSDEHKKFPVDYSTGNFFSCKRKLLGLDLAKGVAVVGQAIFAHPVRQPVSPALGAGHDTGSLQLPNGAAPLIAPGLRHFSLRNRHG